jgi:hypothetical protein
MENTSLDEFVDADASTEESDAEERGKSDSTECGESDSTEHEETESTKTEKSDSAETGDAGSAENEDAAATDPSTDPDAVTPATIVSAWSGESATCAQCDESVQRLWIEEGQQVCGECKTWA